MFNVLEYLRENVDDEVRIVKWNAKEHLSLHLASIYEYYHVSPLGIHFLMMRPKETVILSKIQIHMNQISETTKLETVLLLKDASPYLTKEMLKKRISFISEDKQMYLSFIALHLKKYRGTKMILEERSKFTAATQMVYLKILYSQSKKFEVNQLADELELSKMTVLRAVEELQNKNLVTMEIGGQTGRKKLIYPIGKEEYYRIGKQHLIDPVKKTIYVRELPEGTNRFRSGLTALAEKTMLAEPKREVLAVYENIGRLKNYQVTKMEALEEDLPDIQIMCYDIGKLTKDLSVDPITLIMSLDEQDERVEMAIEELMEEYEWFKG